MPFLLLMPSFNQAHFIREAVDSVLAQNDPDWDLLIRRRFDRRDPDGDVVLFCTRSFGLGP